MDKSWNLARAAIGGGFFAFGATAAIWLTHIPVVTRKLALDPATLGIILFVSTFASFIANGFMGTWIARVGSQRLTLPSLFAWLLSIPLLLFAPSAILLTIAGTFTGLAAAALNICLSTQAAAYEAATKRSLMSWFHAMFSIGGIAGALAGAGILAAGYGDGTGAALASLVCALAIVPLARAFLPDPPTESIAVSVVAALFTPAVAILALIAFCADFIESTINDWGPLFLTTVQGTSEANAALGFAVYSGSIAIARLVGSPLIERFGPRPILIGGGGLVAIGVLLAIATSSPFVSVAGFVLVAFGGANMVPVMMSQGAQTGKIAPSTAIAALSSAQSAAFMVSPPLVGTLAQVAGLSSGLLAAAAIGLIAAVAARFVIFRQPG